MARRVILAISLAALMTAPAFAQQKTAAPANDDPVVARINGQVVHRSDLQIALELFGSPQDKQASMQQIYPQLLMSVASETLLAQAARKAKIDANPAVKTQINLMDNHIITGAYVGQLARGQITEAKLREAYDQYAQNASKEEEISARHILVGTEQEAKNIIEQLKKGADFATLAKEKTTDPSGKASGGDLGYFTRQQMVPEFANAAFALKTGEFTQSPIQTQFGWHVIKVEDRRPGKPRPYDQVAPLLGDRMMQQIANQKLQELRSQGKVELFDFDGKPVAAAAPGGAPGTPPAQNPAQAQRPAAPTLSLPGQPLGAASGAPGAPTLSPATAPDKLQH